MLIGYFLMVSLDESREVPIPFPFPLSLFSWQYFKPGTCTEYGLLFLKQGLMESNRRSRGFAVNIASDGTELYPCISLAFIEDRHSSFWRKTQYLAQIYLVLYADELSYCVTLSCMKQISKTKQNENLIKMLLRAGVDVNATDFVSGFIQMQMWFVCVQQY